MMWLQFIALGLTLGIGLILLLLLIASWLGNLKSQEGWMMAIGATLIPVGIGLMIWVVNQPGYYSHNQWGKSPQLISIEVKRISLVAWFGISVLLFVSGFALSRLRRPEVPPASGGPGS